MHFLHTFLSYGSQPEGIYSGRQSSFGRSNQKGCSGEKCDPAQIVLAWLLAPKPWIVPMPGTTKLERLYENLGVDLELTPVELRAINSALAEITIAGDRHPEALEKRTGR